MKEEGLKYDTDKLRWDLLPLDLIEEIVKVYTAGSVKYGDNNWKYLENGYNRCKAAMFRHLLKYEQGETRDKETGCLHLAQVAWNAIAMIYFADYYSDYPKLPRTPEATTNMDKEVSQNNQYAYVTSDIKDAFSWDLNTTNDYDEQGTADTNIVGDNITQSK